MSIDRQRTLSDYQQRDETAGDAQPSWSPGIGDAGAGRVCKGCGAHASSEFARVLGDNDGNVHACPRCVQREDLARGAAADPDYEHRIGINKEASWR